MRRIVFSMLLMTASLSAVGAGNDALGAWTGTWKGACGLTPAFSGVTQFAASLEIGEPSSAGQARNFKLIYEESGALPRQVRDYELRPVDASSGHFVVDEHNGLLLDTFLSGNVLYSNFVINGNLIQATYILNGDRLLLDMPSFDATPVRETCLAGNSNSCAQSLGLRSVQRCELARAK